ncbi:hybrid sensor histidine kinase/response regulator [Hydrogenophaga sp.]|uniref:hybrid sensor histidine kinase/response regulator n=1 Tax=Hydrogenophaga sp. TaxID=1904254 RepID=UPI003F6B297E
MSLDLLTLLAVRLGVDFLIAMAFLGLMRRYPGIGGPGWWSLSAVLTMVGSIGLWLRVDAHGLFSIGVANTVMCAGAACVWLGIRSYLGLVRPLGWVVTGLVGLLGANVWLFSVWDSVGARQVLISLTVIVVGMLAVRDIARNDPQRRVPELQALKIVIALECTVFTVLGFLVVFMAMRSPGPSLTLVAPGFLFAFLLTKLLRAVLLSALVAYRLRRDGDQARQVLQIREADSRALVENLSAGVMVFRPDSTLSHVNGAARRFLGWGEGGANPALPEPIGSRWTMLAENGQAMRRHDMPFERVLATGQPVRDVVMGISVGAGAPVRWALCNAHPENDAQGGLRHVVLTFVDISSLRSAQDQQKTLQSQLAQSQKMEALGTLAGGVAHDFNNILAAILGNADLARQDLQPDAPARESLHEISTAARRGRELVRQILAFSRQQPMVRQPVQVADVVAESCSLLRAALPPQVELLQCCAAGMGPVMADATQLGQVLLNLGTNAVYALQGRPGRIEFRVDALAPGHAALPAQLARKLVEQGQGAVRIQVLDNGSGMSEAIRNRIFEPFFTTKPMGSGTGLGLPVVLGIVESLGGAIEVQSALGQGTTFALFFPVVDTPLDDSPAAAADIAPAVPGTIAPSPPFHAPAHLESSTMADAPTTESRHILYLDDDDTLVFLVRRLLERRGYRVTTFTDQAAAIDAVRADPQAFDLLLTDYNMPGMSGLEVAKAVLVLSPALPVAMASGYITDELHAQALAAGVREVVFKTDAVEAFCEVVARLAR